MDTRATMVPCDSTLFLIAENLENMGKQLGFITDNGRWLMVTLEGRRESGGGVFILSSNLFGENALANLPLPAGRTEVEGWPRTRRQRGDKGRPYPTKRQSLSALIQWGAKELEAGEPAPITLKAVLRGERMAYEDRHTGEKMPARHIPEQDWRFTLTIDFLKPRLENQP